MMTNHTSDEVELKERGYRIMFHAALKKSPVVDFAMRLGASLTAKDANGQMAICTAVRQWPSGCCPVSSFREISRSLL